MTDYTKPYLDGCTPPSSTSWADPDNNVAFHNHTIVMTHNFTISIAAKWLDDANNPALTDEQRAAGKKAYEETIITASFPNKPDGSPIKYRSDVKTGLIFTAAKNKAEGKEFVKIPAAGGKPSALHRRRARSLVPGDDGEPAEPVLAGRPPSQGGL